MTTPRDLVTVASGDSGATLYGSAAGEFLGISVAAAGDVNGDGIDDFLVAAYPSAVNPSSEVYLVFGVNGGLPAGFSLEDVASGQGGLLMVGASQTDWGFMRVAGGADVNNDGLADILIAAPGTDGADGSATDAGAVYVIYGSRSLPTGTATVQDLVAAGNGIVIHGTTAQQNAGESGAFARDINDDGFDDILVGAPHADVGGKMDAGCVYVVFGGDALPSAISLADVATGAGGFVLSGTDAFDNAGASVASAGDVNGDGINDILVGAPGADGPANTKSLAGTAYVVFGRADGFAANVVLDALTETTGLLIHGRITGQQVGKAVAGAGDINDDGFADILIGVQDAGYYNNLPPAGETYVIFGRDTGFGGTLDLGKYGPDSTASDGFMIYGRLSYDAMGTAVAGIGDINGDRIDDFIVGVPAGDGAYTNGDMGEAFVVFGHAGQWSPTVSIADIRAGDGGFALFGSKSGGGAGCSVAGIGDINGDGLADIAVGAPFSAGPGGGLATAGEAYVIYGARDRSAAAANDDRGSLAEDSDEIEIDVCGNDEVGATLTSTGTVSVTAPRPGIDAQDVVVSIVENRLKVALGTDFELLASGETATITVQYTVIGADGLAGGASLTLTVLGSDGEGILIDLQGPGGGTGVGGGGDDLFIVDDIDDIVLDGPGKGIDTVRASIDWSLGENLENLELQGSTNLQGTGNSLGNRITGNDGDNTLDGGSGKDTLIGGIGSDTYLVDDSSDVIIETTGTTGMRRGEIALRIRESGPDAIGDIADSLRSSAPTYVLPVGVENGLLLTGAGNGALGGNTDNNLLEGNADANVLRGGSGNDTLRGGAGSDVAVFAGNSAGYRIETLIDGTVRVTDSAGSEGVDVLEGMESIRFADRAVLIGGAPQVQGTASADTIDLRAGGAQAGLGGGGNDVYLVDDAADAVVETAGGGRDRVESAIDWTLWDGVEDLRLTGLSATSGRGNDAANLIGGNALANRLLGEAGNDTLVGGDGADTLEGGSGNDRYVGVTAEDALIESAGGGLDTIETSISWVLGDGFERLALGGTGNINGTGNSVANRITGNAGINVLVGGTGNDTLVGGAGRDTLEGGAGNDRYIVGLGDTVTEAAGGGFDTVQSATGWALGPNLESLVLTGTGNARAVGNVQANRIIGNSGDNVIAGGRGADTLTGGGGADRFVFDTAPAALNVDRVLDFDPATDTIALASNVFRAFTAGALDPTAFRAGDGLAGALAPTDRILYDTSSGALYYDADGSAGIKAAVCIAVLEGAPSVGAGDILIT